MLANSSSEQVTRQTYGRFSSDDGAVGIAHLAIADARVKEVAADVDHLSGRNTGAGVSATNDEYGDMGENDSLGG